MNITLSLCLQVGSVIVAIISVTLALVQYSKKNRFKKAEQLHAIVEKLWSDKDICSIIYEIEESSFRFDSSFYESGLEFKTDKALDYLSYFCYLRSNRLIGAKEFVFLEYIIKLVVSNQEIQAYLYNLYHFSRRNVFHPSGSNDNLRGERDLLVKIPFDYLLQYAEQQGLLKEGFYKFPGPFEYIMES